MKIVTIVGARPQFIKASAVSRAIARYNCQVSDYKKQINELLVHTGQHYDHNMSQIFFEELEIPRPSYNLGIGGSNHGAMTGLMLEGIESLLFVEKPDIVMVYGDTNSTLAGALAASKMHIPVAHVEAGLRSFNKRMPEEINRVLTDHVSTFLFCPTVRAVKNLQKENLPGNSNRLEKNVCHVALTGDVMFDAALYYAGRIEEYSKILQKIRREDNISDRFALCTIHRAENTDNPKNLESIFKGLNLIARHCPIVLPLHPRTRKFIKNLNINSSNISLLDPMSYLEMIGLIKKCQLVLTDSGGLQKEAFFFRKPCVTLREETEWVELTENKYNLLAGSDAERIYGSFLTQMSVEIPEHDLYGDGSASEKIVNFLTENV